MEVFAILSCTAALSREDKVDRGGRERRDKKNYQFDLEEDHLRSMRYN